MLVSAMVPSTSKKAAVLPAGAATGSGMGRSLAGQGLYRRLDPQGQGLEGGVRVNLVAQLRRENRGPQDNGHRSRPNKPVAFAKESVGPADVYRHDGHASLDRQDRDADL